jgi:PelA/Pel-15E family pectate lyase
MKQIIFIIFFCVAFLNAIAQKIVVAADGSGQFTTIQAAINSLPDSATTQRVIFIKRGVYREKIWLQKHNILLQGEKTPQLGGKWTDEGVVKIIYSESREIFRCSNKDDWGAGTMNIRAKDITLVNLLIINDFGFVAKGDSTFICDGVAKITRKDGHQFALRCMPTTQRLTVQKCNFHSWGGDTVSPWDVDNGTFKFLDCTMEGAVDFYCPRGWAYAENCYFICHNENAAIWHDGTGTESAKTVLKNCRFVGDKGFKLGRFHRDAQFYLVNCKFSKEMADGDIYKVRKDTQLVWEKRVFYYNCHRESGDFGWHKDNLDKKIAKQINADWTLKERWNTIPLPPKTKSDYGLPKVANAPAATPATSQDIIAENMLIAQRNDGGWAKMLDGKTQPPPYNQLWDNTLRATIADDKGRNDATIDNNATNREIKHLAQAYKVTRNPKYKEAAEKGIGYLLKMQYQNGGFPQFYPDTSSYRKHITYNDNAMIQTLTTLKEVASGKPPYDAIGYPQRAQAIAAVERGVDCILKTQIVIKGKPTLWCAQHHFTDFSPVQARTFELPSFSGSESVGILDFLMELDEPNVAVRNAIIYGITFLDSIKIVGFKAERIFDSKLEFGQDIVLKPDVTAVIWARFYDLKTQKPFFSGRDGVQKDKLSEIEHERRIHYAWYGTWAQGLLSSKYPKWLAKWRQ